MDEERLSQVIRSIYPESRQPPRPFDLINAALRVRGDPATARAEARATRTTARRLSQLAGERDLLGVLLGQVPPIGEREDARLRATVGQLVIGRLAEIVFEEKWTASLTQARLALSDDRSARGDTDYIARDEIGRQVFRINIKFHGSRFRRARELVGLDPADCFALATYKIFAALQKQESEALPYIFVVVGIAGLSAGMVGERIPDDVIELALIAHASSRVSGKRSVEDAIADALTARPTDFGMAGFITEQAEALRTADWRVLSARRANQLLRDQLFERAFALRVRGFASNYRNAELDMHFSVTDDLRPVAEFFAVLNREGMPGLVTRLERGTI